MRYGILIAVLTGLVFAVPAGSATTGQAASIARGRYLVAFGACNDCHTPGWRESDGNVPVSKWMTGSTLGFRGPWGTVYPANVRERFSEVSESAWLAMVRTRAGHPPMTWQDLRALSLDDRRAIYAFIRSLGKDGPPSLASVPPEREPLTPYVTIVAPAPPTR